jgi:hypothetical protein
LDYDKRTGKLVYLGQEEIEFDDVEQNPGTDAPQNSLERSYQDP